MARTLILTDLPQLSSAYLDAAIHIGGRGTGGVHVAAQGTAYQPTQAHLDANRPFDLPPGNYRVPKSCVLEQAPHSLELILRIKTPQLPPWDLGRFNGFNTPESAAATRAALDQAIADLTGAGIDVLTPTVPKETATMSTQQNGAQTRRPIYRAQPKLSVVRPRIVRQSPAVAGDHRYEAVGKLWMVVANNMDTASATDPRALLSVQRPPQVVQGTREHADDVAAKLARDNPGTEFHVLESVSRVRVTPHHVEQPIGYQEQL